MILTDNKSHLVKIGPNMSSVHYHRLHFISRCQSYDDVCIYTRRQTPADLSRGSGLRTLEKKSNKTASRHICIITRPRRRRSRRCPYACVGNISHYRATSSRGMILDLCPSAKSFQVVVRCDHVGEKICLCAQLQTVLLYLSRPRLVLFQKFVMNNVNCQRDDRYEWRKEVYEGENILTCMSCERVQQ